MPFATMTIMMIRRTWWQIWGDGSERDGGCGVFSEDECGWRTTTQINCHARTHTHARKKTSTKTQNPVSRSFTNASRWKRLIHAFDIFPLIFFHLQGPQNRRHRQPEDTSFHKIQFVKKTCLKYTSTLEPKMNSRPLHRSELPLNIGKIFTLFIYLGFNCTSIV